MREIIVFEPIAMERVWGGRSLEALYGIPLPHGVAIGELWEIVDREDVQSLVHDGPLRGSTLHDLWKNQRESIFGRDYVSHSASRFPLLLKLLDARDKLSVQVHPPAEVAPHLKGEPKTEMWYFAHCEPGAKIYAGLKNGETREHFEDLLWRGNVEKALHEISASTGDSISIPSGRLHAIGGGNVIVEVQQNSDTTYRVFDWNRAGLDGKPRKLHLEESLLSINFQDHEPRTQRIEEGILSKCEYFCVEKVIITKHTPVNSSGRFVIITVVSGRITCDDREFSAGSFFFVPAANADASITALDGKAEILRTTLPVNRTGKPDLR